MNSARCKVRSARLTHGSLFSGVGGFDLGFHRAGFETRWQVENDRFCNQVLQRHWPEVKRYGDIRKVKAEELEAVNIVSGGFPCQDLSVAGKRKGLAGERSGLFFEFVRILRGVEPRWCVVENVPGLLSSNGGEDFWIILSSLAECGYFLEWAVLDSQHFGVPQRRRRVFVVGHFGEPPPRPILLVGESGEGNPAKGRQEEAPAAYALTGRAPGGRLEREGTYILKTDQEPEAYEAVCPTLQQPSPSGGGQQFAVCYEENQRCEVRETKPSVKQPSGKNTPLVAGFTSTTSSTARGSEYQVGTSPSIRPLSKAAIQSEMTVRRLTPIECERLQGFLDGWTCSENGKTSDAPRYRALGNAVSVPVAEWVGRRIIAATDDRRLMTED